MRARRTVAVALAFAVSLVAFAATRGDERAAAGSPSTVSLAGLRPDASTAGALRRLQDEVRAGEPREAELAGLYVQAARESGDPGYYARAEAVLETALRAGSDDAGELSEAAGLAAARHDFAGALALARRARAAAPGSNLGFSVLVDALVELGRYEAAERALQRMIDRRPDLPAYARVSYLRELHGDLGGAVAAMARAVAAGGPVPATAAETQTLLGGLELARGDTVAARRAYATALAAVPGFPAAEAGRARLAAVAGDLPEAIARWRRLVERLPLPEYAIALGEAELAAGRRAAGREDLELVRVQAELQRAAGVDVDTELAIFEADHGDAARAVVLARGAWKRAPSVRSADALGWALTRAGRPSAGLRMARRALRLGWRDPLARYHAGMTALAAAPGDAPERARGERDLRLALAHGLAAHPYAAAAAREALR